jgi:endonuclease/exonuclease/phosphatase family metal-dependent hydrolase
MKIVFFNVWHGQIREGLADFLRTHVSDTDVFCFQEASPEFRSLCRELLPGFDERNDRKLESEDEFYEQSTYVRPGITTLSSESLLQENRECGLALSVTLSVDGKTITVCNVHGIAQPGEKLDDPGRLKQSRDIIASLEKKEGYKIVGGDFNLMPETESVKMFAKYGYRDLIEEFRFGNTRNEVSWAKYQNKQCYSDYLFLGDGMKVEEFSVPYNEISDHLPLILKVSFLE